MDNYEHQTSQQRFHFVAIPRPRSEASGGILKTSSARPKRSLDVLGLSSALSVRNPRSGLLSAFGGSRGNGTTGSFLVHQCLSADPACLFGAIGGLIRLRRIAPERDYGVAEFCLISIPPTSFLPHRLPKSSRLCYILVTFCME